MPLVDQRVAAREIGVEPKTLENWRGRGGGPDYYEVGEGKRRLVRYDLDEIRAWARSRRRTSTSDQGEAAAAS